MADKVNFSDRRTLYEIIYMLTAYLPTYTSSCRNKAAKMVTITVHKGLNIAQ